MSQYAISGLCYTRGMNEDIAEALLPLLEAHGQMLTFKRREMLSRMGDPVERFMLICEGRAKLLISSDEGKDLLLAFTRPHEILGDLEFFAPGNSTVSIRAVTECRALSIDLAEFRRLAGGSQKLLKVLGRSVAFKLRRSNSKLSVNILYPLRERFASYLFGLVSGTDRDDIRGDSLMDMADLLGTSYRHLNRIVSQMAEEGLLERTPWGLRIKDLPRLAVLARDIYFY